MSAVPLKEVVDALRGPIGALGNAQRKELADRIEQHGIARPSGPTPVAWAIDTPYGRGYSFADEVLGKWSVEIDANGCSTHPKARHGFNRQASHSEGEHVCECAGFDPYDAGYQDGIRAAWDANGTLLPDGWVLVPKEPTDETKNVLTTMLTNCYSVEESYYDLITATAPEVSE